MPSTSALSSTSHGFVPTLLANLVPLAGVVFFGWQPATIIVVYVAEVLVSFPIASLKALFAAQPADTDQDGVISVGGDDETPTGPELVDKHGSVSVVAWLPPVYPRNVPFATSMAVGMLWFGLVLSVAIASVVPLASIEWLAVGVSTLALVGGQCRDVWWDYIVGGRYETVSPYAVVETPARQAMFLVFGVFVLLGGTDWQFPPVGALGSVVALKLVVEWSAYRATHGGTGRLSAWLAGPDDDHTDETSPPSMPDGDPDAVVTVDRRGVLATAVTRAAMHLPFYLSTSVFVVAGFLIVLGGDVAQLQFAVYLLAWCLVVVAALAVRAARTYLRYAYLEYCRYGDRLIAYDRWLATPQWAADVDTLRDSEVLADRLPDRLLGTRTVHVTVGLGEAERTRRLGPVADADRLIETFELPIRSTALEPLDRGFAATAGATLVALLLTVGVLSIADPEWLLQSLITAPFWLAVPWLLWRQAYPD